MTERFRLLFRGEVLEGQHKAVVKKRLAALLKLDGQRLDALFDGEPSTIRADVDRTEAARYQAAFKKAGARLRVTALAPESAAQAPDDGAPAAGTAIVELTLADPGVTLGAGAEPAPPPPDTSHLSVAAPGSDLLEGGAAAPPTVVDDPGWELAERGADLGQIPRAEQPVDVAADFNLAPLGADMDQRQRPAPPPAPDTSHLNLEDEEEEER